MPNMNPSSDYNFRNHVIRIDFDLSGPHYIQINAAVGTAGADKTVYEARVYPNADDVVYIDLLPILGVQRVGDSFSIFSFQVSSPESPQPFEPISGTWVCGTKATTAFSGVVEPLVYITKRFSPLYRIPVTGTDIQVVVDGTAASSTTTYPHTATFAPSTSFALVSPATTFEKACEDVQFVYLNSVGAVVNYIPKGNCFRTDRYSKESYKPDKYSMADYKITVQPSYVVNTEYLDEAQATLFVTDFLRSPYIMFYHPEYPSGVQCRILNVSELIKNSLNTNGPVYYEIEVQPVESQVSI